MNENIIIAVIGSLLVLDTTVAFQFLISQPLIACTIIGSLMGNAQMGLMVGFYLQLIWLSYLPVGAAVVPEGNVASIVMTTLVIRFVSQFNGFYTVFMLVFVYTIAVSYFGGQIVVVFRKLNSVILNKINRYIESGDFKLISTVNALALILHFLLMFGLIISALIIGDLLFPLLNIFPEKYEQLFKTGSYVILGIGAGFMLKLFRGKENHFFSVVGFIAGIIIYLVVL